MVDGEIPSGCTLCVLVRYRDKTGTPSIGSGLIKFRVICGDPDEVEDELESLLHQISDSSSLMVLGFTCCCESVMPF